MIRAILSSTLVCLALLTAGCSTPEEKKPAETVSDTKAVNTTCPMMSQPVSMKHTVIYKGKTVAMCCKVCIDTWEKLTDEERDSRLVAVGVKLW